MIITTVQITDAQLRTLRAFLDRVTLVGAEVGAFVDVSNIFAGALEPQSPREELNKDNVAERDLAHQRKAMKGNGSKVKK